MRAVTSHKNNKYASGITRRSPQTTRGFTQNVQQADAMNPPTLQSKLRRAGTLQNSWRAEVKYRIVSQRLMSLWLKSYQNELVSLSTC
jgi:hypothetical protein